MLHMPDPPPEARAALAETFGFADFRPTQAAIIGALCAGHDAVAIMPTGAGKSLCYQVPALVRPGTALVISPLIALMHDQVRSMQAFGVRAAALTSADDPAVQADARTAFADGALDLLYVSPERLAMPGFQALMARQRIALVAIDEAHCVSEWGHDFRPDYRMIRGVIDALPGVPRLALTATADATTRADICANLGISPDNMLVAGFDRPNISYHVSVKSGQGQLLRFLAGHRGDAGIIYCRSRAEVDALAADLAAAGLPALPYHAGLDSLTRVANQRRWAERAGQIMVATVAFGMGVDKPDVRFVAHMGLPKSIEGYYQETGRGGRDGEPAVAWMLHGAGDAARNRGFIDAIDDGNRRMLELARLNALLGFAETHGCRRVPLLGHFGDTPPARCQACDNCLNPPKLADATDAARKLLSAVYRTGQRFGAGYLADVLRGQTSEKITARGHEKLGVFGIGRDLAAAQWQALARQLEARAALVRDPEHGGLALGPEARAILKGDAAVAVAEFTRPVRDGRKPRDRAAAAAIVPDDPRFDVLRALRRDLAAEAAVPPYVIFHDSVLHAMIAAAPRSLQAMAGIPGIGAAKLKAYGAVFLKALETLPD
jgi:ATP-dependent DNA helicase RecQ